MTTDAVQTMIPTLDVTERPAPRPKVEAGVKLRGAEKVARIPVKIIPTTELPKKPDWIRVRRLQHEPHWEFQVRAPPPP